MVLVNFGTLGDFVGFCELSSGLWIIDLSTGNDQLSTGNDIETVTHF
jgi:hypothetical protein